jgi:hypothetical protein
LESNGGQSTGAFGENLKRIKGVKGVKEGYQRGRALARRSERGNAPSGR